MRIRFKTLIQIGLIIGAVTILILGSERLPWYYRPKLMAALAFVFAVVIEVPSKIFHSRPERKKLQSAVAFSLAISSIGTLGAWSKNVFFIPYDTLVHFLIPFVMLVSGTDLFSATYKWQKKRTAMYLFIIIAVLGVTWEYIEYWLYIRYAIGYFGALFDWDSVTDILANLLGLLAGLIFILSKSKKNTV